MGLDIGDSRIGVALSDLLRISAQPFCNIERNKKDDYAKLLDLIETNTVKSIVVGLPLEMSGEVGAQATKVQNFIDGFVKFIHRKKISDMTIEYIDERLTTVEAKRVTSGSGLKNKDCRAALDRVSASIILETYLLKNSQNV
ncbi:MAG: Holliday junction resolvase RuvX [Proteobacteria bacterium]|nr:Holliday junction resolvase RuvX [Pseudomonadota bacterium]